MSQQLKYGPMLVIGVLFFVFGFVSWLNAILIPYFKLALQLSLTVVMLVAFAFYLSYFVMALPSSWLLQRMGFKTGMSAGLCIMAIGTAMFIPAAYAMNFLVFLVGLFVQATGLTVLQTAVNPYVTALGPIESAATRMSVMGVCNKVAGALAPVLFLRVITDNPDEIDHIQASLAGLPFPEQQAVRTELTERLIVPYGGMTVVLVLLAFFVYRSGLPDIKDTHTSSPSAGKGFPLFRFPQLVLGIVAIFCSVGVEVLVIDSLISYAEYHHFTFARASYLPTHVLLIMIGGYLLGIWLIPKHLSQRKALMACACLGTVLTLLAIGLPGDWSVWCITLLGLANALVWPTIWPLALDGLGVYTKQGSALMIMGIIGGAVLPFLYGVLGDKLNPQLAYAVMLPLYGYLLYFAYQGSLRRRNYSLVSTSNGSADRWG